MTSFSSTSDIAKLIDHAILQPSTTLKQMRVEMDSIRHLALASLCVRPFAVSLAVKYLDGSRIPIGCVVGFPHGGETTGSKRDEALRALDDGAVDIDFVVNASNVLSEAWDKVSEEIEIVTSAVHQQSGVVKVIFENAYVPSDDLKIKLCEISSAVGVDFVKTSTGFAFLKDSNGCFQSHGATEADIRLMRKHSDANVGVKASGGIRTLEQLQRMVEAGANRIGTAATLSILEKCSQLNRG